MASAKPLPPFGLCDLLVFRKAGNIAHHGQKLSHLKDFFTRSVRKLRG